VCVYVLVCVCMCLCVCVCVFVLLLLCLVWVCVGERVGGWVSVYVGVYVHVNSVHGWYTLHVHLRGEWHSFECFYIHVLSL